jgi:type I restriction enzyme S subunit
MSSETDLPSGWQRVSLEQIADVVPGNSPPSSTYNEEGEGLPFYQGKTEFGDLYPQPEKWCTDPKKVAEEGDVLVSVRAPVGPTNLCPDRSCIGRGLAAVRPKPGIQSRYILWAIRAFENDLARQGTGTTFDSISSGDLREFEIPLAPSTQRESIVAKIEELFSNLDAGMDDLQAAGQQLERYRLSVLQAAVEGRLTADWRRTHDPEPADQLLERILEKRRDLWEKQYRWERYDSKEKQPPSGWKDRYDEPKSPADEEELPDLPDRWLWTSLDAVTWNNIDYRGKTPPYSDSGIPTISAGNVKNGEVSFETRKKYVSEETYEEWLTRGEPEPGDLIITTEAPPGQTALLPEDQTYLLTRRVLACQTVHVDNRFLQLCFAIGPTERHVRGSSRGTTVDRILKKVLFKTPLPLPPIQEQKQIVDEVERLLSVADDAAATAEREHARAERLRQSILKQAFSGRLVPHEKNTAPLDVDSSSFDGQASSGSGDTGASSDEDEVIAEELYNGGDPGTQIEMDL